MFWFQLFQKKKKKSNLHFIYQNILSILFLGYSSSDVNGRDEGKAAIVSIFLYIVAIFISWKAKDQIIVEKLKRSKAQLRAQQAALEQGELILRY